MNNRHLLVTSIVRWLPLAVAVTFLSAVIYLAVQQSLRLGANEVQA